MSKPIENIGVIRESRPDENRTPLVPEHIQKIKSKYPNLNILVQPSKNRCFTDDKIEIDEKSKTKIKIKKKLVHYEQFNK